MFQKTEFYNRQLPESHPEESNFGDIIFHNPTKHNFPRAYDNYSIQDFSRISTSRKISDNPKEIHIPGARNTSLASEAQAIQGNKELDDGKFYSETSVKSLLNDRPSAPYNSNKTETEFSSGSEFTRNPIIFEPQIDEPFTKMNNNLKYKNAVIDTQKNEFLRIYEEQENFRSVKFDEDGNLNFEEFRDKSISASQNANLYIIRQHYNPQPQNIAKNLKGDSYSYRNSELQPVNQSYFQDFSQKSRYVENLRAQQKKEFNADETYSETKEKNCRFQSHFETDDQKKIDKSRSTVDLNEEKIYFKNYNYPSTNFINIDVPTQELLSVSTQPEMKLNSLNRDLYDKILKFNDSVNHLLAPPDQTESKSLSSQVETAKHHAIPFLNSYPYPTESNKESTPDSKDYSESVVKSKSDDDYPSSLTYSQDSKRNVETIKGSTYFSSVSYHAGKIDEVSSNLEIDDKSINVNPDDILEFYRNISLKRPSRIYTLLLKLSIKAKNQYFQRWKHKLINYKLEQTNNAAHNFITVTDLNLPPKNLKQPTERNTREANTIIFENFSKLHFSLAGLQKVLLKNMKEGFNMIKYYQYGKDEIGDPFFNAIIEKKSTTTQVIKMKDFLNQQNVNNFKKLKKSPIAININIQNILKENLKT